MNQYLSKATRSSIFKLGIYQIIGGVVGILMVAWTLLNMQGFNGLILLLYGIMVAFFAYSIYCGVLCADAKEHCLTHSLTNQALQVASFAAPGYAYRFAAGLYFNMGVNLSDGFHLDFGVGFSSFNLLFNTGGDGKSLYANLVAVGLLIWIRQTIRIVTLEKQLGEIAELGKELEPQQP